MAARSAPRLPLRAAQNRAEDAAQPLLPGAALLRLRHGETTPSGALPCHEGRGRLGRRLHRVLRDQPRLRRDALHLRAALGRRRRAGARRHVRAGARARRAGGLRAPSFGRPLAPSAVPPTGSGSLAAHVRLPARRSEGDGEVGHPPHAGRLGGGGAARALGRLRHRLRVRRSQLSADAVPVALLQQAHGRVRWRPRESCPLLARDARGRSRGGRRGVRHRGAHRGRGARPVRRRARRGSRLHPARRPPRRSLGRQRRLRARVVEGLGRLQPLPGRLAAALDVAGAGGDGEADRGRRPAHESGPDGGDRLERRLGRDRRRPAFHRRPVPARQDRGRSLRRDPRVHRLQHLHPEIGSRRQHRLHAERDRGRGVPAGLASGALRAGGEPRPRRARRRRGPSRHGVRDRAREARLPARAPRRRRPGDRRDHALGAAACPAGGSGRGCSTGVSSSSASCATSR